VRGYVAVTDFGWYRFLRDRGGFDEVNFWRPSDATFGAIPPGGPFFFKLKAPHDAIGGFGLFLRAEKLPIWRAWDVFEQANGVPDESALRDRLARLSRDLRGAYRWDRVITCIVVSAPVFFAPDEWVAVPAGWPRQAVSGKGYDLDAGEGRRIWEECLARASAARAWADRPELERRTGAPQVIVPRLGQGSFRLAVLDAYGGQCAVTTEHSLPVVEAAHIRPWSQGGRHELSNGLPLRRDLHRLFDLGFVTIRPDLTFAVSPRLREDYANGRVYYDLDGTEIQRPPLPDALPSREALEWHRDEVFRAR